MHFIGTGCPSPGKLYVQVDKQRFGAMKDRAPQWHGLPAGLGGISLYISTQENRVCWVGVGGSYLSGIFLVFETGFDYVDHAHLKLTLRS